MAMKREEGPEKEDLKCVRERFVSVQLAGEVRQQDYLGDVDGLSHLF